MLSMMNESVKNFSPATLNAFHKYLYDTACVKAIYTSYSFTISQKGILEQIFSSGINPFLGAYVYSKDYASVVKK
jgi:hypothetical protein